MANCYICGEEISFENETEEHILLNAIGGILKTKTLICKKCNSEFGQEIDAELSKQLNFVSNMLNIKRDRGEPQNLEVKSKKSGEQILIQPGGKPVMRIPKINKEIDKNNGITFSIVTPNITIARKTLKGLKRTYKQIDVEDILSKAKKERKYLSEKYEVNIVIGGEKAFRSICKTAINFYMLNGGSKKYIEHLISYIRGEGNSNCVQYFYNNSDIIPKNSDEVLHSIVIKGNSNEKLLLAYIELFNCYKFIILLNDEYDGNNIDITYHFNVLQRSEVNKSSSLNISRSEILGLLQSSQLPLKEIERETSKLLSLAYKKQNSEHINSLLQVGLDNSLKKYPEGEIITEDMINELVNETMKQVTPWIINKLKNK